MIVNRLCRQASAATLSSISKGLHLVGVSSPENSSSCVRFSSTLADTPQRKDTGDRSSVSDYTATVFGATGFLGRYVVQQLARIGSRVFVPYRGSVDKCKHLKLIGDVGQVVPVRFDVRDEDSIYAAMARSDIVVNLIGRDYESHKFSFEELNIGIPERISRVGFAHLLGNRNQTVGFEIMQLARQHGGIDRYIQVSALGASPENPARQYQTKAAGEDITLRNFPKATILRPAHFVGAEDRLLNIWAVFAKKMPVVPIIGDGSTKYQPTHVTDVAAAIVAALKDDGSSIGKTFELGGPDVYTANELVSLVYETIRETPKTLHIPFSVAKLIALSVSEDIFKSIPNPTPKLITFSRNNIKSLRANYVVSWGALTFNDLGIKPQKLEGASIEHLCQYRTNGASMDAIVGEQASGANS